MEIPVEHCIRQVVDGTEYQGHLKIDGVRWEFKIKLTVPIPQLAKMRSAEFQKGERLNIHIALKKGGRVVELTNDEFDFFAHLLFTLAERLYHLPKTRAVNGAIKIIVASINAKGGGTFDFRPEELKMLHDKFGCILPKSS